MCATGAPFFRSMSGTAGAAICVFELFDAYGMDLDRVCLLAIEYHRSDVLRHMPNTSWKQYGGCQKTLESFVNVPGKFVISFRDDGAEPNPYNVAIVRVLDFLDPSVLADAHHVSLNDVDNELLNKRARARRHLLRLCPGSRAGAGPIVHVCSPRSGCHCRSRAESVKLIVETFSMAFSSCLPPPSQQ